MILQNILTRNEGLSLTTVFATVKIKDSEDVVKLQGGYRPFRVLGKELEHEIPASQMRYTADYKETNKEDQCFRYLSQIELSSIM